MFGFSDDDANRQPPMSRRTAKWVAISVILAVLFAMLPSLGLFGGIWAIPGLTIMITLTVFVIMRIAKSSQQDKALQKRKRGLEGQDMYSLIDRLVDDLDEDELDYLRRRLEDREPVEPGVADSLGELLDQREDARRSDRR
jgi:hypothetical protein